MKIFTDTIKNALTIITLGFSSLSYAAPITLNFDDFDEPPALNGSPYEHHFFRDYGGLRFSGATHLGSANITAGYAKASSGTNYASIWAGTTTNEQINLLSSSRPFDFKEVHLANFGGHYSVYPTVKFTAYNAKYNKRIATKTVNLSNTMRKVTFNWKNISHIDVQGIPGSHPTLYSSAIALFMDDMVIDFNESVEVPIPAAAFLFAPALLGFMGLRRKAKASERN